MNFILATKQGNKVRRYYWSKDRYYEIRESGLIFNNNGAQVSAISYIDNDDWEIYAETPELPDQYELIPVGDIKPIGYIQFYGGKWMDINTTRFIGDKVNEGTYARPIPGTWKWAEAQINSGKNVRMRQWSKETYLALMNGIIHTFKPRQPIYSTRWRDYEGSTGWEFYEEPVSKIHIVSDTSNPAIKLLNALSAWTENTSKETCANLSVAYSEYMKWRYAPND
jgi:hypothetical protein